MIRPYKMPDGSILFFDADKKNIDPLYMPTGIVPEDIIMEHFMVDAVDDSIAVVDERIEKIVMDFPFKKDRLANLAIAVSEAVANAVRHGAKSKSHKVGVNVMYIPEVMLFVGITDDAGKLKIEDINLDISETFTTDETGRGFLIMTHLSSMLAYIPDNTSSFKEILIGLEPLNGTE